MDGKQLIQSYRMRADDMKKPYLWSDDEILAYLSEAEKEAADRARLIRDATTPEITRLAVRANVAEYRLNSLVLEVLRVKLVSQPNVLTRTTVEELDAEVPDWEKQTGTPTHFIDKETRLRLFPIPSADDVLMQTVFRLPLNPITKDSEPEIHPRRHFAMVNWALHLGYLKPDSDAFDEKKSNAAALRFEMEFGAKIDANVERKQRDKAPTVVKYRI